MNWETVIEDLEKSSKHCLEKSRFCEEQTLKYPDNPWSERSTHSWATTGQILRFLAQALNAGA